MNYFGTVVSALGLVFLVSCNSVAPRAVETGRFDYNEVVQDSSNDQLLLNLVRQAHLEPHLMLEIDQINVKYDIGYDAGVNISSLDGVSAGRSLSSGLSGVVSSDEATANYGGSRERGSNESIGVSGSMGASYAESPTVTYKPLQGEDYAKRLLEGIDFQDILELAQSVQDIETVFRLSIEQVNNTSNLPPDFVEKNPELPESYRSLWAGQYAAFADFLDALQLLNDYGAVRLEYKDSKPAEQKAVELSTERDGQPVKESWTEVIEPPLPAATLLIIDISGLTGEPRRDCEQAWNTVWSVLKPNRSPEGEERLEVLQLSEIATRGTPMSHEAVANQFDVTPDAVILRSGRSLLSILEFVSQCVETPERVTQNVLVPGKDGLINIQEQMTVYTPDAPYFFRVECSTHRPANAFAKTRYRNRWYFIRNDDVRSKKVFAVLSNFVQLRSAEVNTGGTLRVIPL